MYLHFKEICVTKGPSAAVPGALSQRFTARPHVDLS